jgi:hypothetical protein
MSLQSRVAVFATAAFVLASCSPRPQGFDELNLDVVEVGEVPLEWLKKPPPTRVGEIMWYRGEMNGQVFAVIRTQAVCPRLPPSMAGAEPRKDYIELCFSVVPTKEPVPLFSCSTEVYVKYEILGMPKDVEPKFHFKGDCLKKTPEVSPATSSSATPPSTP